MKGREEEKARGTVLLEEGTTYFQHRYTSRGRRCKNEEEGGVMNGSPGSGRQNLEGPEVGRYMAGLRL